MSTTSPGQVKQHRRLPARALALILAGAAWCCAGASGAGAAPATAGAEAAPAVAGMDTRTPPGEDFFRFVNGGWEANAALPAGQGSWGVRAQLFEDNLRHEALLLEEAATGGADPAVRRAGVFYAALADEAGIERKGLAPLAALTDEIGALDSKPALARFLGAHMRADKFLNPQEGGFFTEDLFGLWVGPSARRPDRYLPYLMQGGLGLQDRDAYLSADPGQKSARDEYRGHVAAMLALSGAGGAQDQADRIVALETRIAAAHATAQESSAFAKYGRVWRRRDFASGAGGMDWETFFDAAGFARGQSFGVWQPSAVRKMAALIAATPLATWKEYLRFHAINMNARFLPQALAGQYAAFLGPAQAVPRWQDVVFETCAAMPDTVGRLYVGRYFSPVAKDRAQKMVDGLIAAFVRRVDTAAWLSPATRKEALLKLKTLYVGVGYPDKWRDYAALEVRPDDAFGNIRRAEAFHFRSELAKLGRPVERREWEQGVGFPDLYRRPSRNALIVPAAWLQPPFFDVAGPDAANYGAIGTRIARDIGLAIDPRNSRFDARGRTRAWAAKADRDRFDANGAGLAAQFSRYQPFPDMAVDGRLTLDENIADLAGLELAYDAFRTAQADRSREAAKAADQRFFIAYAQGLRVKQTEEVLRGQTAGSSVAPATYRAATVRNVDAWYDCFDVLPGQALYLDRRARVRIW